MQLSVSNLHIRERTESIRVESKEKQGEMLTLSSCVTRLQVDDGNEKTKDNNECN